MIKTVGRFLLATTLTLILTLLTQVGGVVLLLLFPLFRLNQFRVRPFWSRIGVQVLIFLTVYTLVSTLIVPPLARYWGRVPLPVFKKADIRPLHLIYPILNRHYVKPDLGAVLERATAAARAEKPELQIRYLDANFPFADGFPLLPHLSHDDGRKLDLAFCYTDVQTGRYAPGQAPSPIGYGVFAEPTGSEWDQPAACAKNGYWQYSALGWLVPQQRKDRFRLDEDRTRAVVRALARQPEVEKIFIEPHLKERLGLNSARIRFHGCHAVRHDDHIHMQIRQTELPLSFSSR